MRVHLAPVSSDDPPQRSIHVLYGMGGAGKSETAIKFAEENRESFWGVFWINANTQDTAKQGFVSIASGCNVSNNCVEDVKSWLANKRSPWLLILDNCDSKVLDYSSFFPSGQNGNIIITTRLPDCQSYGLSDDMDKLGPEDSSSLLLKACGPNYSDREHHKTATTTVVNLADELAIALVHAGAYIKKGFCTLEEFPQRFGEQQKHTMQFRPVQMASRYGSVYTTFEISAEALAASQDRQDRLALTLLKILAFLDHKGVGEDIFKRALDYCQIMEQNPRTCPDVFDGRKKTSQSESLQRNIDDGEIDHLSLWHCNMLHSTTLFTPGSLDYVRVASVRLAELSLIRITGALTSMRPLVHEWARIRLGSNERRVLWNQTACVLALSTQEQLGWQNFTMGLQPHVEGCIKKQNDIWCTPNVPLNCARSLYVLACQLYQSGSCSLSLELFLVVFERCPLRADTRSFKRQDLMYSIAVCLAKLPNRRKEALQILRQGIKVRLQTRGAAFSSTRAAQHALAVCHIERENHQEAIYLLGPVLTDPPVLIFCLESHDVDLEDIHKRFSGKEIHEVNDYLNGMHALAVAYRSLGSISKAVLMLEDLVEYRTMITPSNDARRLSSMYELAVTYISLQRHEQAVSLLQEVVTKRTELLPTIHPERLASMQSLAVSYYELGNTNRATQLLEEVVMFRPQVSRPDDIDDMTSLMTLARIYISAGKSQEAVDLLTDALGLNYGSAQTKTHRLLRPVSEYRDKTIGRREQIRSTAMHNLAVAYMNTGQIQRAKDLLELVVEFRTRFLPLDNLACLKSMRRLAITYLQLKAPARSMRRYCC